MKTDVDSIARSKIEDQGTQTASSVLVVGDTTGFFGYLSGLIPWDRCRIEVVRSGEDAFERIRKRDYSLVILCGDVAKADCEEWQAIKEIRASTPFYHLDTFLDRKETSEETEDAEREVVTFEDSPNPLTGIGLRGGCEDGNGPDSNGGSVKRAGLGGLVGASPLMQEVYEKIRRASQADCVVLLQGESGTGKELAARAIHNFSHRKRFPFIPVNCSAIPDNLLESELFGYVRGAFSGAVANTQGILRTASGGTVFFDEIGELSRRLQAKLLRFVEDKVVKPLGSNRSYEIDVRIIVATNVDLREEVHGGGFRRDLYYRISVLPIYMPPLREKKEDIPLLVNHFLEKYGRNRSNAVCGVSPQVMSTFFHYHWPGNVREIENLIQHAIVMGSGPILTTNDLPSHLCGESRGRLMGADGAAVPTLREMEKQLISESLRVARGNISSAARILGIDRKTIYRKMKKLSMSK